MQVNGCGMGQRGTVERRESNTGFGVPRVVTKCRPSELIHHPQELCPLFHHAYTHRNTVDYFIPPELLQFLSC